jgi:hypothetical protein
MTGFRLFCISEASIHLSFLGSTDRTLWRTTLLKPPFDTLLMIDMTTREPPHIGRVNVLKANYTLVAKLPLNPRRDKLSWGRFFRCGIRLT